MTLSYQQQLIAAANALRSKVSNPIDVFVIAGSGFRDALPILADSVTFDMKEIPHYAAPSIAGHGGSLVYGTLAGKRVLVATGRVHMYEGYTPHQIAFSVRMVHQLACRNVILTNAAGSVDHKYSPGTLMAIKDQINLTGQNCEAGLINGPTQFTDMTNCYHAAWRSPLVTSCGLVEGIYAGLLGPSYETRAEAMMLSTFGVHAVGMSTVQECIAARTIGMNVLGLSLITNMAGGLGGPVNHKEVLAMANSKTSQIKHVLTKAIELTPLSA